MSAPFANLSIAHTAGFSLHNEAIDLGMKCAGEKAAQAMEAANLGLVTGVVQGAISMSAAEGHGGSDDPSPKPLSDLRCMVPNGRLHTEVDVVVMPGTDHAADLRNAIKHFLQTMSEAGPRI